MIEANMLLCLKVCVRVQSTGDGVVALMMHFRRASLPSETSLRYSVSLGSHRKGPMSYDVGSLALLLV